MLLWLFTLSFLFLSPLFLYVRNEEVLSQDTFEPKAFKLNDVSYKVFFSAKPTVKDIQSLTLTNFKFKIFTDPGLVLQHQAMVNPNPLTLLQDKKTIDLLNGWSPLFFRADCKGSVSSLNLDPKDKTGNSYKTFCTEIEFVLRDLKFIHPQFTLFLRMLNKATKSEFFLVFKMFHFVFMKDPILLKNIFSPSKDMLQYFRVDNKELMLGSNLVSDTDNKMQLYYKNKADFKFDLGIQNETNYLECTGILLKNKLSNTEEEYNWNVYRPNAPYYIAFHNSTDLENEVSAPRNFSFYVKLQKHTSDISNERFLFHLVCANRFNITLDSYTLELHKVASESLHNTIPKNKALPYYKLVKKITDKSPVQIKRFYNVPNNNPSSSPILESKTFLYYPPIPVESPNLNLESLMKAYVKVQSSFIKRVTILNHQVPLDTLDLNSVKLLEFDWNLDQVPSSLFEFIFHDPFSSKVKRLNIFTQIEVVVWPKNGNDFRNPFSFFFKPLTSNLIPTGLTDDNIVVDFLYDEILFEKYELMKEMDRFKLEYRFFLSNSKEFTFFNIYLNPIKSTFVPSPIPSDFFKNYFDEITFQGKAVEMEQMQADCSKAKIFDLILEESTIFYSFKMKESVTDPNLDFKISVFMDGSNLTAGSPNFKRSHDSFILLNITAANTVYVEDLDNRLIQIHIQPVHHGSSVVEPPVECIQARVHVPSYIYRLERTSMEDLDKFFDELDKSSTLLPVRKERIADLFVNIYRFSRSSLIKDKKYLVPTNELFTSFFVQVKKEFESALNQALSFAEMTYSSLPDIYLSMRVHANHLAETLLLPDKDSPRVSYASHKGAQKIDMFLAHIYTMCTLVSKNPKFLSLYMRAMNSPRFQFLYPTRVYSKIEMDKATMLSQMMTLCNYRKWVIEQTLVKQP